MSFSVDCGCGNKCIANIRSLRMDDYGVFATCFKCSERVYLTAIEVYKSITGRIA